MNSFDARAPVTVGDGAYSGAGAVIRKDVPAGALAINASPQRNAQEWVIANRPGSISAQLAQAAVDAQTSTQSDPTTEGE